MNNLKFVGAAAILSIALLGPAMGNQPVRPHHAGVSTYCAIMSREIHTVPCTITRDGATGASGVVGTAVATTLAPVTRCIPGAQNSSAHR